MSAMPRTGKYFGMPIGSTKCDNGTWIEDEEWAYPKEGFTRRAMARCEDGKVRLCACSIPDTFFSIPARCTINGKRVKGFLTMGNEVQFIQYKE